jgi:hypothetical protein
MLLQIIKCEEEADAELARDCSLDPTGRCFVLGNDSDFYLFKGCRYIPFSALQYTAHTADDIARVSATTCTIISVQQYQY